jgi:hypothetical protein
MFDRIKAIGGYFLLTMLVVVGLGSEALAQDGAAWRVSKSSGEVWVTNSDNRQSALTTDAVLKPGDSVRTGQNGRVLLVRGEETILVSPNSVIGIPTEKKAGLSTTIIHQAGTILLDVEKRNVKHFSVETPYLAAVVKGTQFRVTVGKDESSVDVLRGQVEVTDFKSGQSALVLPNQNAKVSMVGPIGLLLSGSGTLNPIQQGTPRRAPDVAAEKSAQAPASAAPEYKPAPAWSESSSFDKDNWWASLSAMLNKAVFNATNSRGSTKDDIVFSVALSGAVGLFVALAVAIQRRRKIRKTARG